MESINRKFFRLSKKNVSPNQIRSKHGERNMASFREK